MRAGLGPARFLSQFSAHLQHFLPHDRVVISHLDDDGRTFTIFAEHAVHGPLLHEGHYTTDFDPRGRYVVGEWSIRDVFAGTALLVEDFAGDPRFQALNPYEVRVAASGFRSAVVVPLRGGDRVVGVLATTSLAPRTYGPTELALAGQVADLIAPFIENVVLLERERRRRRRLRALDGLTRALGGSLDVRDVFARLADTVRPVLDFDVMGVALLSASGRDVEMLAEVNDDPVLPTPSRVPLDDFSFADAVVRGEAVMVADAQVELDPHRPGDRLIIDGEGRSVLSVALWFGERVGGALYFGKRVPHWYDAADVEVASAISAQVVLAVQHQRLADDQARLASAEGRARRLAEHVHALRGELGERYAFDQIVGRAPALREALARAAKVAPTDTTVLVTGESGTGKELVARAIHQASQRSEAPFVAINCAALPETLLESELFGHERGAFTGADRQKPGRFERAAGGTLFLDEVAELSPAVQAKLLRVLQERTFERVGGTTTLHADVRLVAATNRDLDALTASGRFREDLYYRLNVFTVHLPPLRERGDDVLLLADHFARSLGARMGKGEPGLSRDARDALLAHTWPGNIRELQNAIERALIVSDGGLLTAAQLGITPRTPPAPPTADDHGPATHQSLAGWERQIVVDALKTARGNKSRAARVLGLTRSQLYTRLKRFGLDTD
jgi:Nif-specific regulatory protein